MPQKIKLLLPLFLLLILSSGAMLSDTENAAEPAETAEPLFTDEEAFALGDSCAKDLQRLYLDYLYFEEEFLKLQPTGNTEYAAYDEEESPDSRFLYFEVESDTIRSFDELKAVFREFCTEKYAMKLLQKESVHYKDIDGKLYMLPTELCFMGIRDAYLTSWEQRGEDEIVFMFTYIGDDLLEVDPSVYYAEDYVHDTNYDHPFTMTVIRQDGKWLISDCDDPSIIGYVYRADTFGERGECGGEEARRLADEFSAKIKETFLDYFQYDREKLELKPNGKETAFEDELREKTYAAIGVESDTVKTYEELRAALLKNFAQQGLPYLLDYDDPRSFHRYMDIDGELYMIPSEVNYEKVYESARLIDWHRWGNNLMFVYYIEDNDSDPDSDPNDRYIEFSVTNQDGKRRIYSCSRPDVFGYCRNLTA